MLLKRVIKKNVYFVFILELMLPLLIKYISQLLGKEKNRATKAGYIEREKQTLERQRQRQREREKMKILCGTNEGCW